MLAAIVTIRNTSNILCVIRHQVPPSKNPVIGSLNPSNQIYIIALKWFSNAHFWWFAFFFFLMSVVSRTHALFRVLIHDVTSLAAHLCTLLWYMGWVFCANNWCRYVLCGCHIKKEVNIWSNKAGKISNQVYKYHQFWICEFWHVTYHHVFWKSTCCDFTKMWKSTKMLSVAGTYWCTSIIQEFDNAKVLLCCGHYRNFQAIFHLSLFRFGPKHQCARMFIGNHCGWRVDKLF